MTPINIELPTPIHDRARTLATRDGVSLDQLIATALAEKMSALDEESYFNERAQRGSREAFDRVMAKVPARKPLPGDEFPIAR